MVERGGVGWGGGRWRQGDEREDTADTSQNYRLTVLSRLVNK